VPYHRPVKFPKSPFCFKDGLDPQFGGLAFTALRHWAPNSGGNWDDPNFDTNSLATADTEVVVTTDEPATDFDQAHLVIAAKFQCGWYQYAHRWAFGSDGTIHPSVAMGGRLNVYAPTKAHVHNFYFRIDLDIDGQYPNDVFEVFDHVSLDDPPTGPGDTWVTQAKQGRYMAHPASARKWRVRNTVKKDDAGEWKGYEIEIPQTAGVDQHSTGDVWATVYRGDGVQQGEGVGASAGCTDGELETVYAVGPLDTVKGSDIVLWLVVRSHHEPRNQSEESAHLPYHYEEFSIVPRNFTVFRGPTGGGHRG
jgi:Cu2+-containing amine oxidase